MKPSGSRQGPEEREQELLQRTEKCLEASIDGFCRTVLDPVSLALGAGMTPGPGFLRLALVVESSDICLAGTVIQGGQNREANGAAAIHGASLSRRNGMSSLNIPRRKCEALNPVLAW